MDEGVSRLRFDPLTEAAFVEHHAQRSRLIVRVFFGIAAFFVITAGILHFVTPRLETETFARIALGIVAPISVGIFALTYTRAFLRVVQPVIFLGTVAICWSMIYSWNAYSREGFMLYSALVVVLLTPLIYTISRLRFYWAAASAWTCVIIYGVYALRVGILEGTSTYQPSYVLMSNLFSMLAGYYMERAERRDFLLTRMLRQERNRTEAVLANILPDHIAARLKDDESVIADQYEDVVVLFADIVDFTKFSSKRSPNEVVRVLDDVFSELDDLAEQFDLEKIKTIGDAYMVVAGLPNPLPDDAERMVRFALEVTRLLSSRPDVPFQMRIGIHSGPVVAGVIGKRKQTYDLWGDTVNTASRMESTGEPGIIHMSEDFAHRVRETYPVVDRGVATIKGKGAMRTYGLACEVTSPAQSPR